ncbi:DNA-binding response regulator [Microbacterium enclense]|uniref:DNA-binding response regulator n=1 Tax=Microbacterium enclense TaxID=993073 RepID=A0A3S3P4S3_9MICO|nr:response regulator transcription factor [Microbacterium enclense]RWR19986.1 DNA-binding response regulator [Microbacterium enclense]
MDRGGRVVEAARASRATVALLDIEMPGIDGTAAAPLLRTQVPGCRAFIVTTFGRPEYLARVLVVPSASRRGGPGTDALARLSYVADELHLSQGAPAGDGDSYLAA